MYSSIDHVSDIKFGFPGQPEKDGNVLFLQVRQFDNDGNLIKIADDRIKLNEKTHPHILENGDVLFVGKGNRLFAWCYPGSEIPAIASSSFFVLRPEQSKIYPEYLAAILNAPQTKASFLQLGGGTNIFSIRKSELAAFQIPLLPMAKQKRIAAVGALHQKEVALAKQLIEQKHNLYKAIISKLIK